ncbi:MAG TPA: hypothetical protein VFY29_13540 [Terriglobia bacterium]|nr:hypothetical protein [Terriglobia bacterium]
MTWENLESRLKEALKVSVSFPEGTIWLPESHLTIDEWLEGAAEADEELKELEIPRIQFLENRWPVEQLLRLEWDRLTRDKRAILAMYVGQRAYILFSEGPEYQVIAGIEPESQASLYRAVVSKLLENPHFVPSPPTRIRNRRPDLIPEDLLSGLALEQVVEEASAESVPRPQNMAQRWKSFLTEIFVGWIGKWLNMPESVIWGDEGEPKASSPDAKDTTRKRKTG